MNVKNKYKSTDEFIKKCILNDKDWIQIFGKTDCGELKIKRGPGGQPILDDRLAQEILAGEAVKEVLFSTSYFLCIKLYKYSEYIIRKDIGN